MDRLEEIRQRAEAAKAQKEKGDSITAACIAWSIAINDIPYLLAEVDRLESGWKGALELANANAKLFDDAYARAEAAEHERDEYKAALQNWHEGDAK